MMTIEDWMRPMPPVDTRQPSPASSDWPSTYYVAATPRVEEQAALPPQEYEDLLFQRIEVARQALDAGPRLSEPCDANVVPNPEAWAAEKAIREVGSTLLNQIDISYPRIEGVLQSAIRDQIGADGLARMADGDVDHAAIFVRNLDAMHKYSLWHLELHSTALANSCNAAPCGPAPHLCVRDHPAAYQDAETCLHEDSIGAQRLDYLLEVRARAVRDQLMQQLGRIRPFGSPSGAIHGTEDSNPSLVKALNSASRYFPADWITQSAQQYPLLRIHHLTPEEADDAVGFYWPAGEEDASPIEVPRIGIATRVHFDPHRQNLFSSTVLHELSHHFVDINDTVGCLEEVFFRRRTGIGAGFIDPCMGGHIDPCPSAGEDDYPSLEIISYGVESLFMGSYGSLLGLDAQWLADRDHAAFVLGVLAIA